MPRFSSQSSANSATWEPQAADTRLAHTAGAEETGVFTSDLSVSEYVLLGEAGFEPLGFVIGSSLYHIGIPGRPRSRKQELPRLTHALYNHKGLAVASIQAQGHPLR